MTLSQRKQVLGEVQAPVFAPEVEQRVTARFKACFFDTSNQNEMVTSLMQGVAFAFEYAKRAG